MEASILEYRRHEIAVLRRLALWNSLTALSAASAPFLMAAATLGLYVLMDPQRNVLTPQTTFVARKCEA